MKTTSDDGAGLAPMDCSDFVFSGEYKITGTEIKAPCAKCGHEEDDHPHLWIGVRKMPWCMYWHALYIGHDGNMRYIIVGMSGAREITRALLEEMTDHE